VEEFQGAASSEILRQSSSGLDRGRGVAGSLAVYES
jgi:hypothetical protein